jgi:hypothetical protein
LDLARIKSLRACEAGQRQQAAVSSNSGLKEVTREIVFLKFHPAENRKLPVAE